MTRKTFIFSAILITAIIFSCWLIRESILSSNKPVTGQAETPDAFLVKAIYTKMDANGNLDSQISTPNVLHYAKNDISHFTNPYITIYSKDGDQPWIVTANSGQSYSGIAQVLLWDNVKIHEAPGPKNKELTMTTTSIVIYPKTQTTITNQPVTILQPGTVIHSVGLRANLKQGEVHLLSQAKGIYEAVNN